MSRGSVLALFLFAPAVVIANESSTTATGLRNVIQNKRYSEDRRITDNELKAQAGSLSRYSMKFDLSYQGPPIDNLSDSSVPNPDNRPVDDRTKLSGFTGLRYRLNPNEAINISTGLKWYTPVQVIKGETVEKVRDAKDYDFANPQVGYDRTFAAGGVQLRSSVKTSMTTEKYYLQRGQIGSIGLTQAGKYNVNRLILGLSADLDWFLYNREYRDGRGGDGRVSNYYLTFIPSLEYRLTDKLNFKTSVGYSFANLRREGSGWLWNPQNPMARAGLGWAITREIYFNPYLNFYSEKPAIKTTSLSFSTVFSIF